MCWLLTLLKERNSISRKISKHTCGLPVHTGRHGEFIASRIFNIELNTDPKEAGHDGKFRSPKLLECKTVNIKWYTARETILSLKTGNDKPDYYLVMTGPEKPCMEISRPLVIHSVFLFDREKLEHDLTVPIRRNATSVKKTLWCKAEIYPNHKNKDLDLGPEQERELRKFCKI